MPRLSRIHFPVTALGPGRRLGIWFQGCTLACAGCLARDTWDHEGGRFASAGELARIWSGAVAEGADGLTISGGEPLQQAEELAGLLAAADRIRRGVRDRELDFLVYTGYEPAEITGAGWRALRLADAAITGRFDITRPTKLVWRGSSNQVLTPRTSLGARRYTPYLDHEPDQVPMQVSAQQGALWLIGVPGRGDLTRFERALTERNVRLGGVSWRP